jgi:hypothetical protein
MTEWTKFQNSTMRDNYIRLLGYIDGQMHTDEIDYAEREADRLQEYIKYYLEHLEVDYQNRLERIIRSWILKEKILDVAYGFGDATCAIDVELMNTIKCDLYNEINYYTNICRCATVDMSKFYQCWECMVRDCGCKADRTCCGWEPDYGSY